MKKKGNKVLYIVLAFAGAFLLLFLFVPKFKSVVLNLWGTVTGKKKVAASQSKLTV